jgi:hypothetical protein
MVKIIFVILFIAAVYLWRTGQADRAFVALGLKAGRGARWLASSEGAWVSLAEKLPYRDFIEGDAVVETEDGWLFSGLALEYVATDGYSGHEWNGLLQKLNRVLTGLPDNTFVQIITSLKNDAEDGAGVFERLSAQSGDAVIQTLLNARAQHLRREAAQGLICTARVYAFIGRRREKVSQKVPALRALATSSVWVDLEYAEYVELRAETLRARESFAAAFRSAGGKAEALTTEQIHDLVYSRLNPERATSQPAPRLPQAQIKGVAYRRALAPPPVTVFEGGARQDDAGEDEWGGFVEELAADGLLSADETASRPADLSDVEMVPPVIEEQRYQFVAGAGLFAESPREQLCFEPVSIEKDYLLVGERPFMVVSLQQLPTHVFAGLCETFTKHPEVCFPVEMVTSFEIGNRAEWDDKLAKMSDRLHLTMEQKNRPDLNEEMGVEDIKSLRADVKRGEAKVGEVGVNVVFSAKDLPELYRRRDIVMMALRAMEGLEVVVEKHLPLPQFLATLPCAPHSDGRRKTCLTRDAVSLMPVTGGTRGPVRPESAIQVYERVDGGLLYFNPHDASFPSGMSLICGGTGSGKTGLVNYQRTTLRSRGYRLLTMDYGGASYRVCQALGGNFIEVCDARRSYKFGIFDIRPRAGEHYRPEELTPEGLPRDRLAEVEEFMEQICLDPKKADEVSLPTRLSGYLRQAIRDTYRNLVNAVPRLDDFLATLGMALPNDREMAEELIARLEIYTSEGSLGRFLNESPYGEEVSLDTPYTVFNLSQAKSNPRLMLVASLAVNSFVRKMLTLERSIPKALDVDEFDVVSENPLVCSMLNGTFRTARKANMIASVASQRPNDFRDNPKNPAAGAIRDNCEIRWLLRTPNPEDAARVFQLKPGVARLVKELQYQTSQHWRDAVLLWPGGGCAHLRLRHGILDQRLLLGASGREEMADLGLALKAAEMAAPGGRVPKRLREALAADALGARVASGDARRKTA